MRAPFTETPGMCSPECGDITLDEPECYCVTRRRPAVHILDGSSSYPSHSSMLLQVSQCITILNSGW